jgi:outer membrane lipopolysaccharide assembly protein LptE/RlpB
MMIRFKIPCILCITLLTITACGYRFSGGGALPGEVHLVALGVFDNSSGETGVESIVSNDIVYECARNGHRFVRPNEDADAVVSGGIRSVTTRPISRSSVNTVQERRVTVTVFVTMTGSKGDILWQAPELSEKEEYEVADEKSVTEQNKRAAISKLSKRLAEKVYQRMTDDF